MLDWKSILFCYLSTRELYELLALRAQVFVLEQRIFCNDLDGQDFDAVQVMGRDAQGALVACAG